MASGIYIMEHEKNTFAFLRSLPVSPLAVALGKVGWVLCGTVIVLTGNLLLCAGWQTMLTGAPMSSDTVEILIIFVPAVLEVMVWGIFWSTRCRQAATAIIASALRTALV